MHGRAKLSPCGRSSMWQVYPLWQQSVVYGTQLRQLPGEFNSYRMKTTSDRHRSSGKASSGAAPFIVYLDNSGYTHGRLVHSFQ
eukprot:1161976-Pelagomonas_calceolata.AAC.21